MHMMDDSLSGRRAQHPDPGRIAWSAALGRRAAMYAEFHTSPAGNRYLTFVSGGVKHEGQQPERWGVECTPTEALRNLIQSINNYFPGTENVSWLELPELMITESGRFYWRARLVCE